MKKISQIQIIVDEKGDRQGVVMTVSKFKKLMSSLEDLQDLYVAYERSRKKEKSVPMDKAMKDLFGDAAK